MSNQPPGYPPPGQPGGYPPPGQPQTPPSAQPQGYPPPGQPQTPPYQFQQAGAQPPPGGYQPPVQPAKSSTGKTCGIIAAIVGGLVILGIIGVVVVGKVVVDAVTAPADQVNAYLADVKAGNASAAYERTCRSFKSKYSNSEFARILDSAEDAQGKVTSYNVFSTNVTGNTATVSYTLTREKASNTITVLLEKEGEDWKLCTFSQ